MEYGPHVNFITGENGSTWPAPSAPWQECDADGAANRAGDASAEDRPVPEPEGLRGARTAVLDRAGVPAQQGPGQLPPLGLRRHDHHRAQDQCLRRLRVQAERRLGRHGVHLARGAGVDAGSLQHRREQPGGGDDTGRFAQVPALGQRPGQVPLLHEGHPPGGGAGAADLQQLQGLRDAGGDREAQVRSGRARGGAAAPQGADGGVRAHPREEEACE
eukprot:scaffold5103_cov350-Prasinococcus_capsulatus_cf.AAC.3